MTNWIPFEDLKRQWMKDDDFKKAYDDLSLEYEIALSLIQARTEAKMTQQDIAKLMNTTQSVIARLESGRVLPSLKTLDKYAQATGKHLHLSFS